MKSKTLFLISVFFFTLVVFATLITPVYASHCGSLNSCSPCANASHCWWFVNSGTCEQNNGGPGADPNRVIGDPSTCSTSCQNISCNACPLVTTCGMTTYDSCTSTNSCTPGTTFSCSSSLNPNCQSGTLTVPGTPPSTGGGGGITPTPPPLPSSTGGGGGGTTPSCSQKTDCGSCVNAPGCGWAGSLNTTGNYCISGNNSCPSGKTEYYFSSCSAPGNICNVCANGSTYTIAGAVKTGSGTAVPGATVCLDPVTSCNDSSYTAITDVNGGYSIYNVRTGGNGHSVYVQPDNFTVNNNSQTIPGSVCQPTTINFTVTPSSSTGQGYTVSYERCVNGNWQSVGSRCSAECGTPGASCTPTPPYYCSANVFGLPSGLSCTLQSDKTCASSSNNCYRCVRPASTPGPTNPGSGGGGSNPTPGPSCGNGVCDASETCRSCPQDCRQCPNSTPPWIQTSGGDVHSNTNIDVQGGR